MRTIRRFYFYLVAFISLEVTLWGLISLVRTIAKNLPGSGVDLLASGLSLVVVGTPIFLLHWLVLQHDARQDKEERLTRLRALFLYAARFSTLTPAVYGLLAIVNRFVFNLMGLKITQAFTGAGQTLTDNLAAIIVNLAAFSYFEWVLRQEWRAGLPTHFLREMRRLYRYALVIFGLILILPGFQQILAFLVLAPNEKSLRFASTLGNGIALSLIGVPLWVWCWRVVQRSLPEPGEISSLLRTTLLFIISLVGILAALFSAGQTLSRLLALALGYRYYPSELVSQLSNPLATLLVFGVFGAYFLSWWQKTIAEESDILRQAALQRLFLYVYSLAGTITTFIGLQQLGSQIVSMTIGVEKLINLAQPLSISLSALIIGLPLWLLPWRPAQAEAFRTDTTGDHARRSLLRKGYLYLLLFASVVGTMSAAGWLIYLVLSKVLANPTPNFGVELAQRVFTLILVVVWLGYHWMALRIDGKRSQEALGKLHAAFPVLLLHEAEDNFTAALKAALQQHMPNLPVITHNLAAGVPPAGAENTRAVVLPAATAFDPPDSLQTWLRDYSGERLLAPTPAEGWVVMGCPPRSIEELAKDATVLIRNLAEGQSPKNVGLSPVWIAIFTILGGLFLLPVIIRLLIMGFSSFVR